EKRGRLGEDLFQQHCQVLMLRVLDDQWKDHLQSLDHLKEGIGLRGYGQRDPKMEYKRESFTLFSELLDSIKRDSIRVLSHVQVRREDPIEEEQRLRQEAEALAARMQFQHDEAPGLEQPELLGEEVDVALATAPVRNEQKLGRNELCYCGSGKKFKHCHGQIQ
ncbi:SEC-C metal-binding domain-containing protein, partial [Pseudomonas sp.]|uniref:SEC-C metal-binding domain-containing protein n=1 Tax=Pseudomonas sp. TaxID=306 RepID=UPI00286A43B9